MCVLKQHVKEHAERATLFKFVVYKYYYTLLNRTNILLCNIKINCKAVLLYTMEALGEQ